MFQGRSRSTIIVFETEAVCEFTEQLRDCGDQGRPWVADPYNGKMFPDATPPKSGAVHVLKGGGFASDVKNAICATHSFGPGDAFAVGFRIVKEVP